MKLYRTSFFLFFILPLFFCSCSAFKCTHEQTIEVNIPIEKTWEFYTSVDSWSMIWPDNVECIYCTEELKTGSTIYIKIKDVNVLIPIFFTAVEPYRMINSETKLISCFERNYTNFEEIEPEKTMPIRLTPKA